MPKPKKRKRKGKIRVRQSVAIVPKDSIRHDNVNGDTLPKAPARIYRDTGANFKIKIKRK